MTVPTRDELEAVFRPEDFGISTDPGASALTYLVVPHGIEWAYERESRVYMVWCTACLKPTREFETRLEAEDWAADHECLVLP